RHARALHEPPGRRGRAAAARRPGRILHDCAERNPRRVERDQLAAASGAETGTRTVALFASSCSRCAIASASALGSGLAERQKCQLSAVERPLLTARPKPLAASASHILRARSGLWKAPTW